MQDPLDDPFSTPRTFDTPVRPQHLRETYRASGKTSRREPKWKPGDSFGRFELGRLLGQGSSGFVYEATEPSRPDRCALKILVPETTEDLVRNRVGFRRMLNVRHVNLARVYQIHRVGEHVALSMELIEGKTFAKTIHDLRRLEPYAACERVIAILRQYSLALSVMHANYLIHRDIKPQNLMVDRNGNGQVIDYGLVGTIDPETDPSGIRGYLAGTPQYMAPEVWFDQSYLPAGDVYSLGKVIYETLRLISGSKRLATQTPAEFDATTKTQSSIDELGTSVPDILRDACFEMLETKPADRPTALEISRLGIGTKSTFLMPCEHGIYGREKELSRIFSWLDGVLKGQSGRLHISGPSGIGKSRMIDEILRRLASRRWLHVFSGCCQIREDQPLQAFDQICDALATRFAKEDLGVLEVDPGSAAILHQAFPVLCSVVTASRHLPAPGSVPERLDALEAAVRLAWKILETGPMILVIDDAQWADQDSLNVLDRLQAERAGSLGIITVSRSGDDLQRLPADCHLRLGPISLSESESMLRHAAGRYGVDVSTQVIESLVTIAEGLPYRLNELADEFRCGGALSNNDAKLHSLPTAVVAEGLWKKRMDRLSTNARRLLTLIAVAGGTVSKDEISTLQQGSFLTTDAIEELRRQRLIQSESKSEESIRIVHDRVASKLGLSLSPQENAEAHRMWADVLQRFPDKQYQAARIAGHLFEAGDFKRAIEFADLAAIDADKRFATTEAARWHERVIPYLVGDAKVDRIRQTAKSFDAADRPVKAAEHYLNLAKLVDGDSAIEYELRALTLLTRSGQTQQVRNQFQVMAGRLGLPKPKKPLMATLSLLTKLIKFKARRFKRSGSDWDVALTTAAPADQRIDVCLELSRPLCMLDNLYGAELALAGSIRAINSGSAAQKLRSDIGVAVFSSYEPGSLRERSELDLTDLLTRAQQLGDAKTLGDCYAAIAATHFLSARWQSMVEPTEKSLAAYSECRELQTFEIAHTQHHLLAAYWHLGRVHDLAVLSQQMFDHSITRNDLLGRVMACSGLGSCGWLAEHRTSEFDTARVEVSNDLNLVGTQFIDYLESTAVLLRLIYEGRWHEAEAELGRTRKFVSKTPCSHLQVCRISRFNFESLVNLNLLARQPSRKCTRLGTSLVKKLRAEKLPYCSTLADLHEGYLQSLKNQSSKARHLFSAAERQAMQLGLVPLRLAAQDATAFLVEGSSSNRLEQHLRSEGVTYPDQFGNLYALQMSLTKPPSRGSQKG